ncbi:MAG: hypothetical protein ACJ8FB_07690, partial [Sphingomicrobium sp.]
AEASGLGVVTLHGETIVSAANAGVADNIAMAATAVLRASFIRTSRSERESLPVQRLTTIQILEKLPKI